MLDQLLKTVKRPGDWRQKLAATKASVLTFNYDRLFEWAFLNRFQEVNGTVLLYGTDVLNSGFAETIPERVHFATNRFSYLKMHGSIAARVDQFGNGLHYLLNDWPGVKSPISDELFFYPKTERFRKPELLIVFPREKEHIREEDDCPLLQTE